MPQRRIGLVDLDTGQPIKDEGFPVWVGRKIRSPYGSKWMQVNQGALETLAADEDMDGFTFRVFLYLNARLDFENYIRVPQTEMVEFFNRSKQQISRAVKKLEHKGLILAGPKVDRASVWRLNPNYGWKGTVLSLQKAQSERRLQLVKAAAGKAEQRDAEAAVADLEAKGQQRLF